MHGKAYLRIPYAPGGVRLYDVHHVFIDSWRVIKGRSLRALETSERRGHRKVSSCVICLVRHVADSQSQNQ